MALPGVSTIIHKGKKIVLLDFCNATPDQALPVIDEAKRVIGGHALASAYTLTDVTGIKFNTQVAGAFKDLASVDKPHVKAGTVVGLNAMGKIVYDAAMKLSGRNLKCFDDRQSALDWLAMQ